MTGPSLRGGTATVLAVRIGAALLHIGFALPLIAAVGPAAAGRTLAAVSAIELASLVSRLGAPIGLARLRRLRSPRSPAGVPTGPILAAAALSAGSAALVGVTVGLPALPLAIGAPAVTIAQCFGGWHRGAGRFGLAALAHPGPALLAAVMALAVGAGRPLWWYVTGSAIGAVVQLHAARDDLERPASLLASVSDLMRTAPLGAAGLATQALLLAVPVALVDDHPEAATALALALGAFRPLSVLQFGLNFTVGAAVAGHPAEPLDARQRAALDRAAGLQQLTLVPYALVAGPAIGLIGTGLVTGHRLPTLMASWLVLLVGHAVAFGTGPTGQLLMMRGNERSTVTAAVLGLAAAAIWLALPAAPWLRAAGAVTVAMGVQNGLTAHQAWVRSRWSARPRLVLPPAARAVVGVLPVDALRSGGRP